MYKSRLVIMETAGVKGFHFALKLSSALSEAFGVEGCLCWNLRWISLKPNVVAKL